MIVRVTYPLIYMFVRDIAVVVVVVVVVVFAVRAVNYCKGSCMRESRRRERGADKH